MKPPFSTLPLREGRKIRGRRVAATSDFSGRGRERSERADAVRTLSLLTPPRNLLRAGAGALRSANFDPPSRGGWNYGEPS